MKIKVSSSVNRSIQVVDSHVHKDPLFEAARLSVLEWAKLPRASVSCLIECKTWRGKYLLNTYHVLVGAGMVEFAEHLRERFQERYGIDLKMEPVTNETR